MDTEILNKVKEIKPKLSEDGFILKGVFGSYVRHENNEFSDIDILYDLNEVFRTKYRGFKAVSKLDEIQAKISVLLGVKADLVQGQFLGEIASKYILDEVVYVD